MSILQNIRNWKNSYMLAAGLTASTAATTLEGCNDQSKTQENTHASIVKSDTLSFKDVPAKILGGFLEESTVSIGLKINNDTTVVKLPINDDNTHLLLSAGAECKVDYTQITSQNSEGKTDTSIKVTNIKDIAPNTKISHGGIVADTLFNGITILH